MAGTPFRLRHLAAACLALPGLATAVEAEGPSPELELEGLLRARVVTATKFEQRIAESPAVLTVVTRSEIEAAGWRSVAEALRTVPGLYGVDDFYSENVGVRGINGGARAASRILKVMIDGQPVAFRPDSSNPLGPELVPMEAVERIEVMRGPGSALYGANAFLGVVNIRTRTPDADRRGVLLLRGQRQAGATGGGGEALVQGRRGAWSFLLAAGHQEMDRSGHELPPGSPILRTRPPADRESRRDWARPSTAFAKAALEPGAKWSLDFTGSWSRTDALAEWVDFGTLSHANKVVVDQGFGRLRLKAAPTERLELTAYAARAQGQPSGEERLSTGSTATYPRRLLDDRSWDGGLEGTLRLRQDDRLTLGVDRNDDDQQLLTLYTVNAATGAARLSGFNQGRADFRNLGLYAQYLGRLGDALQLTLNAREDRHNRYGDRDSGRAALVWTRDEDLYLKLLWGSSFKAPTAVQLYAQPLYSGDQLGNPGLRPETASSVEAEVGWRPFRPVALSVTVFRTSIRDKIEAVLQGTNLVPVNTARQETYGCEAAAELFKGTHRLAWNLAYARAEDREPDPFEGELRVPTSAYPRLTSSLRWTWSDRGLGTLHADLRYASPRRASASNTFENQFTPYTLPGYTVVDAAYAFEAGPFRTQLRAANLLDRRWAEPGFRGYDVPSRRREWILSVAWLF